MHPSLAISLVLLPAVTGRPAWTLSRIGGDGFDSVASAATMPDGGFVIAGHFEGTLEIGSDRLVSAGKTDAFIARLSPTGEVEWAERIGGAGFDAATAVVVDAAGNPVLIGHLSGTVRAGRSQLRSRGQSDVFVVGFGDDSAIRWAIVLGESDWDVAASAAITADGSIAVAGSSGRFDREDDRARADDSDILVALVEPAGTARWVRRFGGAEWDQGFAIAAHPGGDIEVGGSFGGTLELETTRLVAQGVTDGFTVRLSPAGRVVRARRIGGKGADSVTGLASWPDGTSAVAGTFTGRVSFGATALTAGRELHVFVARADAGGEPIWAANAGAGEANALLGLPDGTLLLAASHSLAIQLVSGDPSEAVLHHIDAQGHLRSLLRLSGSRVAARGLATTTDGDAIVVGSFVRRVRLGSRTIEAEDKLDGFVMTTWLGAWRD